MEGASGFHSRTGLRCSIFSLSCGLNVKKTSQYGGEDRGSLHPAEESWRPSPSELSPARQVHQLRSAPNAADDPAMHRVVACFHMSCDRFIPAAVDTRFRQFQLLSFCFLLFMRPRRTSVSIAILIQPPARNCAFRKDLGCLFDGLLREV
jgi:hypothetical protein